MKTSGKRRRVPRDTRDLVQDLINEIVLHVTPHPPCVQRTLRRAYAFLDNTKDAEAGTAFAHVDLGPEPAEIS